MFAFVVTAVALLLATVTVDPARADGGGGPPSGSITIDKLKVAGTGCRDSTTVVAVSPDREAFTVIYGAYIAVAGGGASASEKQKKCSITVRLNVPAGFTYAVGQTDHRGYAHLEPGASAVQSARYAFQGQGPPTRTEYPIPALLSDSWQVTDVIPERARVYGACGKDRRFDIDTELRITSTGGATAPASTVAMDATDGVFSSTYRLTWKRCP